MPNSSVRSQAHTSWQPWSVTCDNNRNRVGSPKVSTPTNSACHPALLSIRRLPKAPLPLVVLNCQSGFSLHTRSTPTRRCCGCAVRLGGVVQRHLAVGLGQAAEEEGRPDAGQRSEMTEWLERWEITLYLLALGAGALIGLSVPSAAPVFEMAINPVLMVLLYATFLSVPLTKLGHALRDIRFLAGLLVLNFVLVPIVVYGLSRFVADDQALLLGVLLVLLTPCIDYVIVFSGLAGAAHDRLLAAAPLLMVLQMLLLPVYLGLFVGTDLLEVIDGGPFLEALVLLIITPLGAAALTQYGATRWAGARNMINGMHA